MQCGVDGLDFLGRISSVSVLAHAARVGVAQRCTSVGARWFPGLEGEAAAPRPQHSHETWRES